MTKNVQSSTRPTNPPGDSLPLDTQNQTRTSLPRELTPHHTGKRPEIAHMITHKNTRNMTSSHHNKEKKKGEHGIQNNTHQTRQINHQSYPNHK